MTVRETVDAKKQRYGKKDLRELFAGASRVIAAKGKQQKTFDLTKGWPGAELEDAVMGPTGNLRAPAIRTGKTVLVGFSEDVYGEQLG